MLRDTLKRQRDVLGAEHESILYTAGGLATALQDQGKFSEAETVLRDTLAIQQHPTILATADNLALLLSNIGQHAEAEALGRSALA